MTKTITTQTITLRQLLGNKGSHVDVEVVPHTLQAPAAILGAGYLYQKVLYHDNFDEEEDDIVMRMMMVMIVIINVMIMPMMMNTVMMMVMRMRRRRGQQRSSVRTMASNAIYINTTLINGWQRWIRILSKD